MNIKLSMLCRNQLIRLTRKRKKWNEKGNYRWNLTTQSKPKIPFIRALAPPGTVQDLLFFLGFFQGLQEGLGVKDSTDRGNESVVDMDNRNSLPWNFAAIGGKAKVGALEGTRKSPASGNRRGSRNNFQRNPAPKTVRWSKSGAYKSGKALNKGSNNLVFRSSFPLVVRPGQKLVTSAEKWSIDKRRQVDEHTVDDSKLFVVPKIVLKANNDVGKLLQNKPLVGHYSRVLRSAILNIIQTRPFRAFVEETGNCWL